MVSGDQTFSSTPSSPTTSSFVTVTGITLITTAVTVSPSVPTTTALILVIVTAITSLGRSLCIPSSRWAATKKVTNWKRHSKNWSAWDCRCYYYIYVYIRINDHMVDLYTYINIPFPLSSQPRPLQRSLLSRPWPLSRSSSGVGAHMTDVPSSKSERRGSVVWSFIIY